MNMHATLEQEAQGPWEVVRRIRLPGLVSAADAEAVRNTLNEVAGIREMAIDLPRQRLLVRYDVNEIDYATLRQVLENAGYPMPGGMLNRLRASLYQYADTNARDNAKAPPPPCCNKPPK